MEKIHKIALFILLIPFFLHGETPHDYILDSENRKVPIPISYVHSQTIKYLGADFGHLSHSQDLFIRNGFLYVLDTGNNRILKLDLKGEVKREFLSPEGEEFKNPEGLYVLEDGDLIVADTENNRIVHLSGEGKFVESFTKPDSKLYDNTYEFSPRKVYIDPVGQIFCINKDDYHGFVVLDVYNQFRGYLAPTRLPFSFQDLLIRNFATREQKEQLAKRLPPAHSNFVIHQDGMIYTTTVRAGSEQIKKLTTVGKNILNEKGSFGEFVNERGERHEPSFVDISVSRAGIISALEADSGKIFQYDSDGNLLTVFGGRGNWKGHFFNPVAIVEDEERNLYVLDSMLNTIQVFRPTQFITTVHKALELYYNGKYEEALLPWEEVRKIAPVYPVAHLGIAKAYLKEGNFLKSMGEYRKAENVKGYSSAFSGYRHEMFRKFFGYILLGSIVLTFGVVKSFSLLNRRATTAMKHTRTWRWEVR